MTRIPSLAVALLAVLPACGGGNDVSLYCALDQEHSERIVDRFEAETGLAVKARFDTEASKTVGLVSALREEANHPRCDVFWNNELAMTVRLGQLGLLQPYVSPSAADIPDRFKSKDGLWTGFAARARILIVNTELVKEPAERPTSMWDLIDPKWKGKCAVAIPLTGTTLTHFAVLREVLGEQEFNRFVDGLFANEVQLLQSNGAVMKTVADTSKGVAFGFTDTDDFHVGLTKGHPVVAVFPDQGEGRIGTLLIPNSIALVKGSPHPELGKHLIDYVLSDQVEAMLAAGKSAQIPVRASVTGPESKQILAIGGFKEMSWDPEAVASHLDERVREFQKRFGM